MNAPWIFDRVVIADRGAAERGRDLWTRRWTPSGTPNNGGNELKRQAEAEDSKPAWAAPFVGLQAPQGWWAPMRSALLSYLRLSDSRSDSGSGSMWGRKSKAPATKPVVTYVSMQSEPRGAGLRLRDEDHLALLVGLRALQKEGVLSEVHVVKGNGSVDVHGWEWADRMSAIAKSSVSFSGDEVISRSISCLCLDCAGPSRLPPSRQYLHGASLMVYCYLPIIISH